MGSVTLTMASVRVLTLNCWGIWLLSSDREARIAAIAAHLAQGDYDIVLLQEVWCVSDFDLIRKEAGHCLPSSHFFHIGAIGSGTCVLSKYAMQNVTYHEYSLSGNPQDILHVDWYAGKGLGVCSIKINDMDVRVFVSHLHAEYLSSKESYFAHRVAQALEASLWMKLTSAGADLVIFGGDFNSEPGDAPYNVLRTINCLQDAWIDANGPAGGESCGAEKNSYTGLHNSILPGSCSFKPSELAIIPEGQRIDFVMFKSGLGWSCKAMSCNQPLPARIPGQSVSYSDHEGVAATLVVEKINENPQDKKTEETMPCKKDVLATSKRIISDRLNQSLKDQVFFSMLAVIFVFLVISLIASSPILTTLQSIVVSLLSVLATIYTLIVGVHCRKERNALRAAVQSLIVLQEQKA